MGYHGDYVLKNMATIGVELFSEQDEEEKRRTRQPWLEKGQQMIWERIMSQGPIAIPRNNSKIHETKQEEQSIAIDILAKEWLGRCHDLPTKLYLVNGVLPILVLGLESLLVKVGKRGLEEQEGFRNYFNPINVLAQFLMRNNPRYRHSVPSPSPYSMGLNMVAARLRKMAIEGTEEGLESRVKRQLRENRERNEAELNQRLADEQKKCDALKSAAILWSGEEGIPTLQVQQVAIAWLDDMKQHPDHETISAAFTSVLSCLETSEMRWSEKQFIDALLPGCLSLQFDAFMLFSDHMHSCGKEKKRAILKDKRRLMFKDVFDYCDKEKLTLVDRQHLMSLLCVYFDNASKKVKDGLVDPKTWVMKGSEFEEEEESEVRDWEKEGSTVSDEDYQQFMSPTHTTTPNINGGEAPHTEVPDKVDTPTGEEEESTKTEVKSDESEQKEVTSGESPTYKKEEEEERGTIDSGSTGKRDSSDVVETSTWSLTPTGPGNQWSPKHLALPQFLEVCNMFMGDSPDEGVAESLATFIKINFHRDKLDIAQMGTSSEMQKAFLMMKRAQKVHGLFSQWDINCSGYLSMDEIEAVVGHWEQFSTTEGKQRIKTAQDRVGTLTSRQVGRGSFCLMLDTLTEKMPSSEFKDFTNYVASSIKTTQEQKKRTQLRQKLLTELRSVGDSSAINIVPSLEAAVKTIQEDCLQFDGKKLGICISLLDTSKESQPHLIYKAASDECIYNALGKKLTRNNAPISFTAVESGIPVHVPDVHKHGRVFFFTSSHSNKEEYSGSLVVTPIVTPAGQVIGTISVDSVAPSGRPHHRFTPHEISFYQGVGVCLGELYQSTVAKRRLMGAAEAGIVWLLRRCEAIVQIDFYMIKPTKESGGYYLQHALSADQTSTTKVKHCDDIVHRKDNFFRDYLFQCVDTSESVSSEAYCYPHLACPLRDPSGCAVAVIDFTISQSCKGRLAPQYMKDVGKMVKLLTAAFHQAMLQKNTASSNVDEDTSSITVLFHKLLLADLQRSMSKLNKRAFAELRSYQEPPTIIYKIVSALIMTLNPLTESLTWNQCKQYVTVDILNAMTEFEPTPDERHPKTQELIEILKDIPPTEVYRHGSLPAKYLFNWISASTTVLEHIANTASGNNKTNVTDH